MADTKEVIDYSLSNPATVDKYKAAGAISEKVLAEVSKLCVAGEKIVTLCEKGDKLLEEEIAKVYGKTKLKGFCHPTTVSPSSFVTPYTPLTSDEAEAKVEVQAGEPIKIQLGAQVDGFATIVCDTIVCAPKDEPQEVTGRTADLVLANYYANELLLRLMLPPGVLASGTDEEKAKAAAAKPPTQARITSLLEKVAKAYECNLVESTTSWLFDRNDVEGKKKIVVAPGEGSKGDGAPEVGEVWGVEMGMSLGSTGKLKNLEQRPTLHRLINENGQAKRSTSKKLMYDVKKNFHSFPFSMRQLESERDAKLGILECVRNGMLRQYEVVGDKEGAPVARLLTTILITKNGITKLSSPPALDVTKYKTDKKIEDEEILKILEQPLAKNKGNKSKNKNKKKTAKGDEE
jgi:curved DNA binding protein